MSKETVSRITEKVVEEMQTWATPPLDRVYAAISIDATMVKVRDGQVANRPIYAAIGVTLAGEEDVLGLCAGTGGEGAKFWTRCSPICATEASRTPFSWSATGSRGCRRRSAMSGRRRSCRTRIIHLIRNTFRLASRRDWDAIKHDVKPIHNAVNATAARAALERS